MSAEGCQKRNSRRLEQRVLVDVRRARGEQQRALDRLDPRQLDRQLDTTCGQRSLHGFADHRERFRQEIVERSAIGEALPELDGLGAELFVGEWLNRRIERVDLGDGRTQPLDFPFVLGADDLGE